MKNENTARLGSGGPLGRSLVLAHRGDHRRWIENTADALIDDWQLPGVDGVEFDVRTSSDGEPVVLHDETLERTFGLPRVARDTPAIDLMRVGVPHLAQVLAFRGRRGVPAQPVRIARTTRAWLRTGRAVCRSARR